MHGTPHRRSKLQATASPPPPSVGTSLAVLNYPLWCLIFNFNSNDKWARSASCFCCQFHIHFPFPLPLPLPLSLPLSLHILIFFQLPCPVSPAQLQFLLLLGQLVYHEASSTPSAPPILLTAACSGIYA